MEYPIIIGELGSGNSIYKYMFQVVLNKALFRWVIITIVLLIYLFLHIRYLRGLGNASLFIRVVPSINGRNLSSPYVIKYSMDSNETLFLSPAEFPIHRSTLKEDRDKLGPLLDIDADHTIDLVFYIEVYVSSVGDYCIEFEIGYPCTRVIEG